MNNRELDQKIYQIYSTIIDKFDIKDLIKYPDEDKVDCYNIPNFTTNIKWCFCLINILIEIYNIEICINYLRQTLPEKSKGWHCYIEDTHIFGEETPQLAFCQTFFKWSNNIP